MTASPVTGNAGTPIEGLYGRLAALRRRLSSVILLRGLALVALVLLGGGLTAGALDWLLDLPAAVRAAALVLLLGGAGLIVWKQLFQPWTQRRDDLALALRLEQAYPTLNDALASAVQFLEQPTSPAAGSAVLRREAIRRALRLVQSCDFQQVVPLRGLSLALGGSLLLGGVVTALALYYPAVVGTATLRLLDPYAEHSWPRATQLHLTFPRRVARGQPFILRGQVQGVIPNRALVEFDGLSTGKEVKEYPITRPHKEARQGLFIAKVDLTRQQRGFRFRVRANDAQAPERPGRWFSVEVAQPPQLAPLDGRPSPQWELHYPAYTELPSPEKLPPGRGEVEVIAGTNVLLHAASDRPLAQASVSFRPTDPGVLPALYLGLLGLRSPLEVLTSLAGGQSVWGQVPGRLADDRQRFTIEFRPWVSGLCVLRLEDPEGLSKEYEYPLRVQADPLPLVRLEQPSGNENVVPDAVVTVTVVAEDEIFALRSVYIEYRRQDGQRRSVEAVPRRLPLYEGPALERALPLLLSGLAPSLCPLPAAPAHFRPQRLTLTRRWPLAGLVKEGDTLLVQACAEDFNDVPAHPAAGRSAVIELHVVSPQTLAAQLDEAQSKLRQELVRLREWQEKALRQVLSAEQQRQATGQLRPEDVEGLVEAEQLQRQIQARIGLTPQQGLRGDIRRLEQLLRDNRLPPSGARDRLRVLKNELERLLRESLPQIEPHLTAARQQAAAPETAPSAKEEPAAQDGTPPSPAPTEKKTTPPSPLKKENPVREPASPAAGSAGPKAPPPAAATPKESPPPPGTAGKTSAARPAADPVARELAQARRQQEEVKQSLDELLRYFEHWADLNELRGETRTALQEQKDLKKELERLAPNFRPEQPEDQAAVRKVAELQRRLADRVERLLERLERVSKELAGRDPEMAERLRKAAQIGREELLPQEIRDTGEQQLLPRNPRTGELLPPRLFEAISQQSKSIQRLEKMTQTLEEDHTAEVERLLHKQKQVHKELQALQEELERLRQRRQEAQRLADPQQRQEALQRLAQEQRRLEEELRKKARELARLGAPDAAQDLAAAAERLERNLQQLDEGDDPEEAAEQAQKRLEQAQKHLEQAQKQQEEELARERALRLADQLKSLKERQEAALVESQRLHRQALQTGWRRALIASLEDHRRVQSALHREAEHLAEKWQMTPVFSRLLQRTAQVMDQAATTLKERADKAVPRQGIFPWPPADLAEENHLQEQTEKLQREALRRLERLLAALKPLEEQARQAAEEEAGNGPPPGPGGGVRPGDFLPPLAQLKALRDEQAALRERTAAFARAHPDLSRLTPAERAELEALHADQQELFRLFRQLFLAEPSPEKKK
jgi:hypothetical protein